MVQQQLREHNQKNHIAGLAQDCSNSIANALELLQSGTKSSISGMKEFMSMG